MKELVQLTKIIHRVRKKQKLALDVVDFYFIKNTKDFC